MCFSGLGLTSRSTKTVPKLIHYREHGPGVFSCAFLRSKACARIVSEVRGLTWTAAQIQEEGPDGREQILTRRDTRSARILDGSGAAEVYYHFDRQINRIIKPLIAKVWKLHLETTSGTQLIRYSKGGHYLPHLDAGGELADRYFSIVVYLNENFSGGYTSFPSLSFSVKPEIGRALVFPSRYLHCAEPVTSGEKFVVVSWVCGPVPIPWI
jgi:predicted 2-oxoglutarate/Fe(II)-dependent dioxygenase YbiX